MGGFHHHHEEDMDENRNPAQGWLFLIGDVFHNVIDGIALGSAFLINSSTGFVATIALVAHDIPLEVGEFGIQLRSGFPLESNRPKLILVESSNCVRKLLSLAFHSLPDNSIHP